MSISEIAPENDPMAAQETKENDAPKSLEDVIKERALKRKEKWAQNHRQAEEHCKNGDALFAKQDYAGACARYVEATVLWTSNPEYYTKLAEAYLKCHLYAEAAHSATRALALYPKSLEARYHRGMARSAQGLLKAAKIDFELILTQDPTHTPAQLLLSTTLQDSSPSPFLTTTSFNTPVPTQPSSQEIDFSFPSPAVSTPAFPAPSLSDSSDCFHVGNGIPCRFYNAHPSGCALGVLCRFSHAPDEKSVRDNLGKNVCTYHLLSLCKFGSVKCVYSHCTLYLPPHVGAWWSSPEGVERVRRVVQLAEKRGRGKERVKGAGKEVKKVGRSETKVEVEAVEKGEREKLEKSFGKADKLKSMRSKVRTKGRILKSPNRKKSKTMLPVTKMVSALALVNRDIRWAEGGMEER